MKTLTGRRGVAILYAYMLLGLGFLRSVTPDFGDLGNREQELEGSFRLLFQFLHFEQGIGAFKKYLTQQYLLCLGSCTRGSVPMLNLLLSLEVALEKKR